MDIKQRTIGEILDSEKEMVIKGEERYGKFFVNASGFNILLQEFLKSIDSDRFIFTAFLSQVRKHHTLAFFSVLRLHHTQATMDMRQVLEAGACAAYAIAHTELKDFADLDEQGILDPSDTLTKKRYQWLQNNFQTGSDAIKRMKGSINISSAHSNIVYAHTNFRFDSASVRFDTPFFDFEDEYLIKNDLWMIGNVALGLMDLFYGVNKELNVIKFIDDFVPRLNSLEKENHELKSELMSHPRFKRKIDGKSANTG